MPDRKAVSWFILISFLFSWPLFLIPLTMTGMDPAAKQAATRGIWAAAMWGPGLAAILVTLLVERKPFGSLRLNSLGSKRMYLWAWLLPIGLTLLGGALTVLFGIAKVDLGFGMIADAMRSAPGGAQIPAWVIVASQAALGVTLAPFINMLFTMGEELGWRGFLLPRLEPLGQWKAVLLSGLIWGVWHAPAVAQGLNYPEYPVAGMFMMIVFCILLGTILAWLYFTTRSPWSAALAHGSVNAIAGLPILFFEPGFNMTMGGTLASVISWIGISAFIFWLVRTNRFPVRSQGEQNQVI